MKPHAGNQQKVEPTRWWAAQYQDKSIHPLDGVVPFNETKVKVGAKQHPLKSSDRALFPTWAEAHQHLVSYAEGTLHRRRRDVEVAETELARVSALVEPTR